MSRRSFFRTGFIGLFTAAFPWRVVRARGQGNADDISDLKDRVTTLEDNLKKQQTSSPPNVPIGAILAYAGPIDAAHPLPEGWRLCDGSALRAANFEDLWKKLRVPHGSGFRGAWGGDGNPNFNLPDLVGRFLRGVDKNVAGQPSNPARDPDSGDDKRPASRPGGNTGNNVGSVQKDAFRTHKHEAKTAGYAFETGGRQEHGFAFGPGPFPLRTQITSIEDRGDNETRPINAYVYWIIRVK